MRYIRLIPVLTLVLVATWLFRPTVARGQGGGPQETRSVMLAIIGDPLTDPGTPLPSNGRLRAGIDSLVSSWGKLGGDGKGFRGYSFSFDRPSTSRQGNTVGYLRAYCASPRDPAEIAKFYDLAKNRLQDTLRMIHEANVQELAERVDRANRQADEARAVADAQGNAVQSLRRQLTQADASPDGLDEQLRTLKQNRLTLQVELAGLKARHEMILLHIRETRQRLEETGQWQQPFLAKLEEIVKLHKRRLAGVKSQSEAGVGATTDDVTRAQIELSKVQADLQNRRSLVAAQANTGPLGRLNEQLIEVQIATSAAEAQIQVIEKALAGLESDEVQSLLHSYTRARRDLEHALAAETLGSSARVEAQRALRAVREPKVVVIQDPKQPK